MISKELRTAFIWDDDVDDWQEVCPWEIKEGDLFRIDEPDGTTVFDKKRKHKWIALSDSYKNAEGIWIVDIKD